MNTNLTQALAISSENLEIASQLSNRLLKEVNENFDNTDPETEKNLNNKITMVNRTIDVTIRLSNNIQKFTKLKDNACVDKKKVTTKSSDQSLIDTPRVAEALANSKSTISSSSTSSTASEISSMDEAGKVATMKLKLSEAYNELDEKCKHANVFHKTQARNLQKKISRMLKKLG